MDSVIFTHSGKSGTRIASVCRLHPLSVRKSGKTGLRSNEQLFRSIFDNAQIGISFFSVEGGGAFTNRAFQEMLGYSEEELSHLEERRNWDKIVHPDDRASSAKRYAELQQGKRDHDEWVQHFVLRGGRDVFTSAQFTLLRDAGHLVVPTTGAGSARQNQAHQPQPAPGTKL